MASRIFDVSSEMGQLLIQGWVSRLGFRPLQFYQCVANFHLQILTDKNCTVCGTPLMKSPRNTHPIVIKCASCASVVQDGGSRPSSSVLDPPTPAGPDLVHRTPSVSAQSRGSDTFSATKFSTPPTEQLSMPSSPFSDVHPILDTAEILARRAQSDQASSEIGRRMLLGWAMLADECPNPTCYGVPLVRAPRGKDRDITDQGQSLP